VTSGRRLGVRASEATDTELILRAYERWGDACPGELTGDFAFVVADGRAEGFSPRATRSGVKPLHYCLAKRPAALRPHVPDLFSAGAPRILDSGASGRPRPELEGIDLESRSSKGSWATAGTPARRRRRAGRADALVDAEPPASFASENDREYVEAFLTAFREAVSCRLDADTVAMLSGGLDSSAICGVATRLRRPTTVSRGRGSPDARETAHVRAPWLEASGCDPILVFPEDVTALAPLPRSLPRVVCGAVRRGR
jgi:asparagine synthase (glutamine-hydrolysing)